MPYWSVVEEKRLLDLMKEGMSLEDIAEALGRSPEAIDMKAKRMGFPVPRRKMSCENGAKSNFNSSTTTTPKPLEPVNAEDLPSIMQAMQLLWAAAMRLQQADLDPAEVRRLRLLITTVKSYVHLLGNFLVPMVYLEKRINEMEKKWAVQYGQDKEKAEGEKSGEVDKARIGQLRPKDLVSMPGEVNQ
jgi:hypothetical protein